LVSGAGGEGGGKTVTTRVFLSAPLLLSPPPLIPLVVDRGKFPMAATDREMRIGGSIYRAALGFQENGWTAGDPWHSCPRARGAHSAGKVGASAMGRHGALPHGVRHAGHGMEDREERRDGKGLTGGTRM
jgi:hypothetical protein